MHNECATIGSNI